MSDTRRADVSNERSSGWVLTDRPEGGKDARDAAILALIAFFVIGGALLWKLDPDRGIVEAGNKPPSLV